MSRIARRLGAVFVALVLIAAACGGDDDGGTATQGGEQASPAPVESADAAPDDDAARGDDAAPDGDTTDGQDSPPAVASDIVDATDQWDVQPIGTGIKPALALTDDGSPAIAWLTEAIEGGVFYAAEAGGWRVDTVVEGYFYGPIDLAFDPDGGPNIVYHDHQDSSFQPDKGDLTLARPGTAGWEVLASGDPGHDGWDSAIRFGPGGELWAAGIEPIDFGTTDGVEFYEYDGATWSVSSIGGPPITYEFNVSMATAPDGQPVLSYYDDSADQLHVATRSAAGWVDEVVSDVSGGMFSSLVIDEAGTRRVSFYAATSPTAGNVIYAIDDGSGWQVEQIHGLDDVMLGMTGARRITSLQLLADGTPVVASTDRGGVWVSTRGDDGWQTDLVFAGGDKPLGQQVQLVVGSDAWHVVTFEVDTPSPLNGEILYLTRPASGGE